MSQNRTSKPPWLQAEPRKETTVMCSCSHLVLIVWLHNSEHCIYLASLTPHIISVMSMIIHVRALPATVLLVYMLMAAEYNQAASIEIKI